MAELDWKTLEVEINGRTVTGSYACEGPILNVRTGNGQKATQLGGSTPEELGADHAPRVSGGGEGLINGLPKRVVRK